jgi:dolichol kinase
MDLENRRQVIHLAGILFIFLAQFIGSIITLYFFIITLVLLFWSIHIQLEEKHSKNIVRRLEHKFRELAMKFERKHVKAPFTGAIWYFFSCGLVFLIFPLPIASAACIILAVGDAASTIVGKSFGKRTTIGTKTFEGSLAFLVLSLFFAWLFVPLQIAVIGSLTGMIIEMLFGLEHLEQKKEAGMIDDNFAVPIASAIVMFFALIAMTV